MNLGNSFSLLNRFGESMGGEMLVAALAWPHFWVIRIGTLLASVGAGLQCLTGESPLPFLYESFSWLSIGEFSDDDSTD